MGFKRAPILRVVDGGWELVYSLTYETEAGEKIKVPAGFTTDLASIPRVFQAIYPVNDTHRPAAIVHDYLYTIQDRKRSEADAIFLEAMKSLGVRWRQRWVMYLAVRVGGWRAWRRRK